MSGALLEICAQSYQIHHCQLIMRVQPMSLRQAANSPV